jgi:hypothetical protein
MYPASHRRHPGRLGLRGRLGFRHAAAPALAGLIALLAALPTAPAVAGAGTPSATSTEGGNSINIPPAQLGSIASSLPVEDLGLTSSELERKLSALPGLTGLGGIEKTLLHTLLSTLPPSTTLNSLLGSVLTLLKAEITPSQLIDELESSAQSPTEVAQVLSDLAGGLNSTQLGELQGVLGTLVEALSSGQLSQLQSSLETLLGGLPSGELPPLLTPLEGTLTGSGLTQLQALLKNLGSLTPPQLQTQLQELVSGLDPSQLATLLSGLFGSLSPSQLQSPVGELLEGLSFTPTTAGQLAGSLETSLEELAPALGTTPQNLSAKLPALTAPLSKGGQLVSLVEGVGGLSLGVLGGSGAEGPKSPKVPVGPKGSEGSQGSGGSGGASGQDSDGGSGGSGGSDTAGTTMVLVSVLPAAAPTTGGSSAAARSTTAKKLAKVKILSHKVNGRVATLVVQVPSAGRLTLSGAGARSVSQKVGKAGRVTIEVVLSKVGTASLRKHHNRLKVKFKAAFKPSSGAASTATATVSFS